MVNSILVTGSSGFIGTHLVQALVKQDRDVYGVDFHPPGGPSNGFNYLQCDMLDAGELKRVLLQCQPRLIIHLAARTDLDGKSLSDYAANIDGVRNLIAAVAATPGVQRCIYTSSQLVCRVGYVPKDEHDYCPNTLYGESKMLTEKIVHEHDGGGVEWCLVRPTTVWGPGMRPHYQRFFKMIQQGRYFHVGRRPLYKSYSYIGNIVHQYQKFLEAPVELIRRKTFYLADYQPISLRDWAAAFQRELGARPIPTVPMRMAAILARAGDVLNALGVKAFPFNSFRLNNILTEYVYDLSATEQVSGPLPYTMEQGVKETAAWIRTFA